MKNTEHFERCAAFLRKSGATEIRYDPYHAHPRIIFQYRGREQFYPIPRTPGDSLRGTDKAISDLRHLLGIVRTAKIVGKRRVHKTRNRITVVHAPKLTALPDWRVKLYSALSSAELAKRLDSAFLALWREKMAQFGGRSLL